MTSTNIGQKFSQTYPTTTLYWHTCKFTSKHFCSPIRRVTYSKEGELLKAEHSLLIKQARKLVCPVYFYQCPETMVYHTSRTPSSRWSEEGKRIVYERQLEYSRQHRQRPEVKDRERKRLGSDKRKEYIRLWQDENKERRREKDKAKYDALRSGCDSEPQSCKVYFLTCLQTGNLFAARTDKAKYSREGLKLRARLTAKEYHYVNKKIVERYNKPCKECKKVFKGHGRMVYCSPKCSKDSQKRLTRLDNTHQRRAKKYGVAYEPFDVIRILERDKWRCMLCGIKTPKKLRGTLEGNAPEVDHIVPLSMGGGHVPSNVQCACRKCNAIKSNRIVGQLSITC